MSFVRFSVFTATLLILIFLDVFCFPEFRYPFSGEVMSDVVIAYIRIPKTLTAICAGAALSASGLMLQQLFRNPLAGPYVLGVSSGASLAVGLLIIGTASVPFFQSFQHVGIALAGFTGAFLVLLLAMLISFKFGYSYILLLFGVVIGQIFGALQTLLDYLANPSELKQFSLWNMGTFSSTIGMSLLILLVFTIAGCIWSYLLMRPLSVMILGDDVAVTLGIRTRRVSLMILLCTGVLSGVVTAFCGPVAFIGMAVPNLAKMLYKTANFRKLLLFTITLGVGMALLCDIIGHLPYFRIQLPINVSSALIGGPLVLYILLRRRN